MRPIVKIFNTTGSCIPAKHYMLPPGDRLGHVMKLVDEEKYFVFYAGHQTGKTTCAKWLRDHYNREGPYAALWVDLQNAREQPDLDRAIRTILKDLDESVSLTMPSITAPQWSPATMDPAAALTDYLRALCLLVQRPLVVLFDETDGLVGPAMVSFLTQLRAGYLARDERPFPHSVVLIGRRQIRDYAVSQEERRVVSWLGTSSPFNITAEAISLSLFTAEQVRELLAQHTTATGQVFAADAVERTYYLSQGHPWLVNALADWCVNHEQDRKKAVTADDVEAAKENIILERRTHIDALIARLHEERVRRILQPMLIGELIGPYPELNDDFAYVVGLGLISRQQGQYAIANPIYKEIIPRVLSFDQQAQLVVPKEQYLRPDGGLDMKKIMLAWQEFWRQDGHVAAAGFHYREAGPHLMLMAFLQSLLNGSGKIDREYGLGRKALDLMIQWKGQRYAIEVKLRRDQDTLKRGLVQLEGYLDGAGLSEGWLVLFDLRKRRSWKERLTLRSHKVKGRRLHVVGC